MTFSFNLIDQPWIPCERLDGTLVELSLWDLLTHAHEIRNITGETPLEKLAMLPIPLVILYRALNPTKRNEWSRIWHQGRFTEEQLKPYLETWYDRFDLFHPDYPFYQMEDKRVEPKSIIYLLESIGNSGTLYTHEDEAIGRSLSPAQAARLLITSQQFRLGGGISGKHTPNFVGSIYASGVLFWAHGDNLFETLTLNLIPPQDAMGLEYGSVADRPAWEVNDPFVPERETPLGYFDYLTWQTNRVMLYPVETTLGIGVTTCRIVPVRRLSPSVLSPQRSHTRREKNGEVSYPFLYFKENRALWRDYHVLLQIDSDAQVPPKIIEWLVDLASNDLLDRHRYYEVEAGGMLADQAKPIFHRLEQIPLSPASLRGEVDVHIIGEATQLADDLAYKALNVSLKELATHVLMRGGTKEPDKNDVSNLINHWNVGGLYWERLEPAFWDFVHTLEQDPDAARSGWKAHLRFSAQTALEDAIEMVGTDAPSLKGAVCARRKLNWMLKKLLEGDT